MSFSFTDSQKETLECNLDFLPKKIKDKISKTKIQDFQLLKTKEGNYTLAIDKKKLHSSFYPIKESERQIQSLLKEKGDFHVYIFIGNGLGYSIQSLLMNTNQKNFFIIWTEHSPEILKIAFSLFDFSIYLESQILKILLFPFNEDDLSFLFKGLSGCPMTFVPHKGSFLWNESKYQNLKEQIDDFLKKKDVNLTTLTRFEKLWTKNLLLNIPKIIQMKPVSFLFDIAQETDFLVCGAGPNLNDRLDDIKKYRDNFILITVDTALNVLIKNEIDPDLIYTVDPQSINASYLQGYKGNAKIIFDPTSSYHTLRLSDKFIDGFYTSSPFPIFQLIKDFSKVKIGDIDFGGSVSTNAINLAEKMGAKNIFLTGQDLCFTDGLAHCKGAVLEERLNFKENRYNRREKHNYHQLYSLPRIEIPTINQKMEITNDKMLIFKKWIENKKKTSKWYNLNTKGVVLKGIEKINLKSFYSSKFINKEKIQKIKQKIDSKSSKNQYYFKEFFQEIKSLLLNLDSFELLIQRAEALSLKIYEQILKDKVKDLQIYLEEAEQIDEQILKEKKINTFIANSMQRVILMVTEGYLEDLSEKEKSHKYLGIAKKNIILYQGVSKSIKLQRKLLKKTYREIQLDIISLSASNILNKP